MPLGRFTAPECQHTISVGDACEAFESPQLPRYVEGQTPTASRRSAPPPSLPRPPRMRSPRPATTSLPSTRTAALLAVLYGVALAEILPAAARAVRPAVAPCAPRGHCPRVLPPPRSPVVPVGRFPRVPSRRRAAALIAAAFRAVFGRAVGGWRRRHPFATPRHPIFATPRGKSLVISGAALLARAPLWVCACRAPRTSGWSPC